MTINQRAKGRKFEQHVARTLRQWPDLGDMRRGLTQSRGAIEPDVIADGWPFWTECKHCRFVDVQAALRQATDDLLATVERRLLGEAIGDQNSLAARGWAGPLVIGRDSGGDVFFAARFLTLAPNAFGPNEARVLPRRARAVIGKSVFSLINIDGWRNFREALSSIHEHDRRLVVVRNGAPPVVVGWLEALERLWRER